MTSAPVRDPIADHLLTAQNAAVLLRRGPLGQSRTPSPARGEVVTAQAEASQEGIR